MLASSQLDLCMGLDIHMELVPVPPSPVPVPTPFPMPFIGMIEFSPGGLLFSIGIAGAMSAAFGAPPSGPVLVNSLQATKTGDEAQNKKTMPHMVLPPGIKWTPLPKPLKLKMKPGAKVVPDSPAAPPGDAVMVTGSKTVYFEGSNACTLGTLAMSCSDPVRLPSSVLLAIPKGLPVLVGGPPTFDWATAAKAFFLRNKWTAGLLQQLVGLLKPGRLRSLLGWAACQLTGHPVDVATGRLLTRAQDYELRGPIPLVFERFYSSAWAERDSPLGYGWSHTFDERIWVERGRVVYKMGDGREVEFHTHDLPGREMSVGQEIFYGIDRLTLRRIGQGGWEVRTTDGLTREFSLLPGDSQVSRMTRIRNRLGQWVGLDFDHLRQLDGVRTSEGRWLRFEHRRGRLHRLAVPYPYGEAGGWYDQVTFSYSEDGDMVAATDSARNSRTFRYENHLLVQETDRDGVTFYFEYDGRDSTASCVRTWGDDGRECNRLFFRELTYDRRNLRTLVEDSLGHTTTYEMSIANAVIKTLDPHGSATMREFNEHLWQLSETDALGNITRCEYDARGNRTRFQRANGAVSTMEYNASDLVVAMRDPFGVSAAWTYDGRGRLRSFGTSAGETLQLEYDDSLYPTQVTENSSGPTRFAHDEFGQLTSITFPDGSVEQSEHDKRGQIVKVRDAEQRVRRFAYDTEGRLVAIFFPGGEERTLRYTAEGDLTEDETSLRSVRYGYAGYRGLAWTEEAGERTEITHDSEGRMIGVMNELGETYRYERDACGQVVAEVTFEGRERTYVRDPLGRVLTAFTPNKWPTVYAYDALSNIVRIGRFDGTEETFTYDAVGHLVSATNEAGTVTLDRDARHQLAHQSFGSDWVASTFDSRGKRIEITSSRGLIQRIARDERGEARSVSVWQEDEAGKPRPTWGVGFERDRLGTERTRTMAGGVIATRSFDARGLPAARTLARGSEVIERTDYQWKGLEYLVAKDSTTWGHLRYSHDARGRLASATRGNGETQWRSPGPTGNLFKKPDRSDRRYGRGGVLLDDVEAKYAYDATGNVISKELADGRRWSYAWTAAGMLASVTMEDGSAVSFTYDALGRRISKMSNGKVTRWLWDGDVPVHEWTSHAGGEDSKGDVTTWLFEPESFAPLAKVESNGNSYSIVTDYLGTPTEMFDEAGKLAWKAQLDIYGVPKVADGRPADCPWRWAGQYEDAETGLFYNRQRYYDPHRGDFLSQDPIALLGAGPGENLYGYTRDPLTWIDPSGLFPTVDFSNSPSLFPAGPGQSSIVTIVMQGARDNDFTKANVAGGFAKKPQGYTWHHVADFNPETGTCTMQLVTLAAHNASKPHEGSCKQFGQHFGVPYDSSASRKAAEDEGWKKKQKGCS